MYMIFKCLITFILLHIPLIVLALPESSIRDLDCKARGGLVEYRNTDGTYTDCITDTLAIEYDFAYKWYECITQAGHYGLLNNLQPVCILILKKEDDLRYVSRSLVFVREYHRKPIVILYISEYELK